MARFLLFENSYDIPSSDAKERWPDLYKALVSFIACQYRIDDGAASRYVESEFAFDTIEHAGQEHLIAATEETGESLAHSKKMGGWYYRLDSKRGEPCRLAAGRDLGRALGIVTAMARMLNRKQLRSLIKEAAAPLSSTTRQYMAWARSHGKHPPASSVVQDYLEELHGQGYSERELAALEATIFDELGFIDPSYGRR